MIAWKTDYNYNTLLSYWTNDYIQNNKSYNILIFDNCDFIPSTEDIINDNLTITILETSLILSTEEENMEVMNMTGSATSIIDTDPWNVSIPYI